MAPCATSITSANPISLKAPYTFSDRRFKLSQNGRGDDSHHFVATANALQYIECLRYLENCTERTSVDTLAAIDAATLIDMSPHRIRLC